MISATDAKRKKQQQQQDRVDVEQFLFSGKCLLTFQLILCGKHLRESALVISDHALTSPHVGCVTQMFRW